jgi:hypothetical protein
MISKQKDIAPSVDNHGTTIRWPHSDAETARMNPKQLESQTQIFQKNAAQVVQKRVAQVSDAHARDLLTVTANIALPVIGPGSGSMNFVETIAFNDAMVILDAKLAQMAAQIELQQVKIEDLQKQVGTKSK